MSSSKEQFNRRVWTAFSRLIEKRYHRNIGFLPAVSAEYLTKEISVSANGDLIVPLFVGEFFWGAIRVKQGGTLSPTEVESLQKMFDKIGYALLDASESLNEQENSEIKDHPKHSVSMIGGGFEARHQLAVQIHETLKSWSLVSWKDAGLAYWNTDDFEDLSKVSIYVRDILELAPKERQQLLTLSRLPHSMRPHLIVGSYRPLAEYVQENILEQDLADAFAKINIFVDQMPKDYLRLAEVLEMLFERELSLGNGELALV